MNRSKQEADARLSWTVGSYCVIYSRSDKKYYDGKIEKIVVNENEEKESKSFGDEWLTVRYKNKTKTKQIQRNCADIKPIPASSVLSLEKGSLCLIYSHIINLWCKGEIIQVFNDQEGEWLRIKYWDTNEHKICEIQRFSADIQPFEACKQWKPVVKIPKPKKPWKVLKTNIEILSANGLSNIVPLNANEFIVAPICVDKFTDNEEKQNFKIENGIYKFNSDQNEWQLLIEYPDNFYSEYHTICVDYDENIIYIYTGQFGGIWKVDMKSKKFEYCFAVQPNGALTFVTDSKLNIFWGQNNGKHLLWDAQTGVFDIIHEFEQYKHGIISFGMVYINTQEMPECFMLFGGYKGKDCGRSDEIWQYEIGKQKWKNLEIKMPHKMQSFGCVTTLNCDYVIILGGSHSDGITDKIYTLNLLTMKWNQSKILCPFKGVGYGNVFMTLANNVEYINLLQGKYCHLIRIPLSKILSH